MDDIDKYKAQRRDELSREIYGRPWKECCWLQRDAIDMRITAELDTSAAG